MISTLKTSLKKYIYRLNLFFKLIEVGKKPKIIYMMGLGDHFPNLGDQAQAAAITMWIEKNFNHPLIEIKTFQQEACLLLLKKHTSSQDLIFLHSGGNFGDDWYETQIVREKVFQTFRDNRIIQLPQTIFYSDTSAGRDALNKSLEVINTHPNTLIFGRDHQSALFSSKVFTNVTTHARPDMVLSLQEMVEAELGPLNQTKNSIKKVLLILRNDKEGIYSNENKEQLSQKLISSGYDSQLWDTDVHDSFPDGKKFEKLLEYLKFISSFDAVVTDRYHGLIFSVLVKTPCVVLKTHNHKLTSAFDWFDDVNFTVRVNTNEDVVAALEGFNTLNDYKAPVWNEVHFDPMASQVQTFVSDN